MRTSGNVYHDIRRTYVDADDIRDNDREEMKRQIEEHFSTPPAKIYGKKVRNINWETAGRSPKVIQQIKSEVKSPLTKTTVLIKKIKNAAKTIVIEDMLQAEGLHQNRKFYGYVQSFGLNPYLKNCSYNRNLN